MGLESGLCKVVQESFHQENAMFWETAGIQSACMALFEISYSTLKEVNRWDQFDLDIVLVTDYTKVYVGKYYWQCKICQDILRWAKNLYLHNFEKISMEFSVGVLQKCMLLFSSKPRKLVNWVNSFYSRNVFCNNTIEFSLLYF